MKMKFAFAVVMLGASVACNGWPRAAELSEATQKPEKYPGYSATPAEPPPFPFAGRHWIVSPPAFELRGARLQPVGTAGGMTLFAQPGTQAPYGELYTQAGGTKWRKALPID